MRLRIDNRIRVTGATPEQEAALKALCEHENPRRADLPRLEAMLESRRWDGRLRAQVMAAREEPKILRTWRVEDCVLTLPRGVWSKPPLGGISAVEDVRSNGVALVGHPLKWAPKKTPRDYQEAALARMDREEQGLLRQSAGSGKTLTLLTQAQRCGLPTIVIVPSQALLEQWVGTAIQDFGLTADDIGCIGGGTKKIRPLTIALVDSLAAQDCRLAKELSRTFGCLLFDEVYGAPARTRFDVVDCFAARYRFGAGDDECVAIGTRIEMADGSSKAVEDVRAGDVVRTPRGPRRVLHAWFKGVKRTGVVRAGPRSVRATTNTWFGSEHGWIPLVSVERVYVDDGSQMQGVRRPDEREMSSRIPHEVRAEDVRKRWEMCDLRGGDFSESTRASYPGASNGGCVVQRAHEGDESDALPNVEEALRREARKASAVGQGEHDEGSQRSLGESQKDGDDTIADRIRRASPIRGAAMGQWETGTSGRAAGSFDFDRSWVPEGVRRPDEGEISESLQDRFGQRSFEDRSRDRRDFASEQSRIGRSEGCILEERGVGGSSRRVDLRSLEAARGCCSTAPASVNFDGIEVSVFDLEIEGAACYFANGILVHNTRKDELHCLTYDLFGEVLAEAPRAMLEKLGWIHSVRVRLVETGTPAPKWWRDLPPLARATRYLEIVRYLEDDPKRAALVAALACMAVRSGNQVLVFGHHRDHALRMQADVVAMAPDLAHATGRFLGGTSAAKERQDTTVGLLEGRTKAAFATYKALGKGINLPAVSRAVLASPIHGARENVNQVLARINRTAEGKDRPEAAVLYDSEVFGLSPVRKFMAGKRDVVVQTADGRELPARDYIEEWEAKADAEKVRPGSFFAGLG